MISYESVVQQIEKHITHAKQGATEQQLREQLAAIHTLCELVLQGQGQGQAQPQPKTTAVTMLSSPVTVSTSAKLQEQDANGESLFDF